MDQQLKQRLVGLAVIFSLAVIFVPMLLDGPEPERETLEVKIPPSPEIVPLPVKVEEKVIELRRETDAIEPLQARIVDETSEPPRPETKEAAAESSPAAETAAEPEAMAGNPTAAAPTQPANDKPEAETPAKTVAASEAKPEPEPKPKPEAKPGPEAKPLPKKTAAKVGGDSFIVQLGSFTDRNKAYALRDRVRKLKLAAVFIEKFAVRGKTFYRVRVGPFISRDKARVVLNKLRAKYNIKGQVMSYDK